MMSCSFPQWWCSEELARKRPFLEVRTRIISAIRNFFTGQGFLEVDTPSLQISPGMEAHLHAFATDLREPFGQGGGRRYLHTSPEFAMKKLLAGGLPKIFQMSHVFRNEERSPLHYPEFTMLEWYRAGADYRDLMDDVTALFSACGVSLPCERLSVAGAFQRFADIDILATIDDPFDPSPSPARLVSIAHRLGIRTGDSSRWDDAFFHVFLEKIEPSLGQNGPTILYGYPACMAALSRRDPDDPRLCERFEVYWKGMELANAFGELTDPVEQRRRFDQEMTLKQELYGMRYPIDDDFLEAVGQLPDCAGIAVGLDRLVMAVTGAEKIEDVLWAEMG